MNRIDQAIANAQLELHTKPLRVIQVDTAYAWAGRAIAAMKMGLTGDAIEYAHEAIEHAALSGHTAILTEIQSVLRQYQLAL